MSENVRAYTIEADGRAVIDMTVVAWKSRQTARAARANLKAQAAKESTETLLKVIRDCRGTRLAQYAARELARRTA